MSVFCGGGGGGVVDAATDTLSNVAVFVWLVSWLVTIRPSSPLAASVSGILPIVVHAVPSEDVAPLIDPFPRVSRSHTGAVWFVDAMRVVDCPAAGRVMNSMNPVGVSSRI